MNMIVCACGCGGTRPALARNGTPRRFINGHQNRVPSPAQIAHRIKITSTNGGTPWNKGRSYVIAKRTVYAHKGAWMHAVRRWHGDACMRCGWDQAACDAHHIIARSAGGLNTIENGIVLCPNCHRLAHSRPDVQAGLAGIKAAAIPVAEAR